MRGSTVYGKIHCSFPLRERLVATVRGFVYMSKIVLSRGRSILEVL